MTEQGTSYAFGGCRDSKNVVSEDLDWSVQLAISYKLSPFRAELLTAIPEKTYFSIINRYVAVDCCLLPFANYLLP